MPYFTIVYAAVHLLSVTAQTVKLQADDNGNSHIKSAWKNQRFDQSITRKTCYRIYDQDELSCRIELMMENDHKKHCDVKIGVPNRENPIWFSLKYTNMLMENKLVLHWIFRGKEQHKLVSILDMDKCDSVTSDFPVDVSPLDELGQIRNPNFNVLVYNDSYHVSIDSKKICGEQHNPCTIRYNHEGKQISQPIAFPSKYFKAAMVVDKFNSSSGGFFINIKLIREGNKVGILMNVSYVSHEGLEMKVLRNHFTEYIYRRHSMAESSEHGYFSFCSNIASYDDTRVHCFQYDTKGQKIMDSRFILEEDHDQYFMLKVFPLRHGGVVIVINHLETDTGYCVYVAYLHQFDQNVSTKYGHKCLNKITRAY
ncbi:uncharacterized protein LOC106643062 [Copidosoma floridanum]|uniref:uncharacterized protein LOC106643062 n=1 Tax=Copidosoma floridanum TaxID=29053 RepID=UPI0006C96346|nr:uncharacterized protein LOC106643062 [Copidosoma floridanum]